jgi:hypothetical protein
VDPAGNEYESDTGNFACPAILTSHVRFFVNINAVGPTQFTFYAPHVRQTYLGAGVYRYRMTIGRSDNQEWMAEGPWSGRCIGYSQWGIGKVLTFEGTVWRVNYCTDLGAGGGGTSTEFVPIDNVGYDPYDPTGSGEGDDDGCSGGGGGSGTPYEPGDYTGGETVDWGTGAGNGGSSACGDNARVEYVCIDEWVEGTGWVEWGCGYVTTC